MRAMCYRYILYNFKLKNEQRVGLSIGNANYKLTWEQNHKKSKQKTKKTAKQNNSNIKIFQKMKKKNNSLSTSHVAIRNAPNQKHRRCSVKKGVLKNFTNFTRKHQCWSLFFNKVAGACNFI